MAKFDIKNIQAYFAWQDGEQKNGKERIKFSRNYIQPVRETIYGLIAHFKQNKTKRVEQCDILLLHPSKKSMDQGRKDALVHALRNLGYTVLETYIPIHKEILKNRLLLTSLLKLPLRWKIYADYASYLVKTYQAKIIITEMNGSRFSPFLRKFQQNYGNVAHLAHGILNSPSRRYSFTDFDYYFIYGQSSLAFLENCHIRFGHTKVVLAGSYLFNQSFHLEPLKNSNAILFLGSSPEFEAKPHVIQCYQLVAEWKTNHPDVKFFVKPHPRSQINFWSNFAKQQQNVVVFQPAESFTTALSQVSLVIADCTNAIIDAAILNRPAVVFNTNAEDLFTYEQFLGNRISDYVSLDKKITTILENYDEALKQTHAFANYHLAKQQDSVKYISECISKIISGDVDFDWIALDEKITI